MKPEFPKVVSASLRETANACVAKFNWQEIQGIRSKGESVHLVAGGAYAAALEAYRKAFYGPIAEGRLLSPQEHYQQAIVAGLRALITKYGAFEPVVTEGEFHAKDLNGVISAYVEYLVQYPPSAEHAKPSIGPLGPRVEFSFVLELPECIHPVTGEPILYAGRFDQLAEFNGALFVFDDKTTGSLGQTWRSQWDLRSQFTGYVYGAMESALPVVGAIVRGVSLLKTKNEIQEAIVYRPQWMIDRWRQRLAWDINRLIGHWQTGYWPHTGEESGACTAYGGCPYKTLCTSEDPSKFIPVYFEEGRWDPVLREVV